MSFSSLTCQLRTIWLISIVLQVLHLSAVGNAAIRIPSDLNKGDREEALRILGFGTAGKIQSDPYPLGGYSGFEGGVSLEDLPIEDLGQLGSKLSTRQEDVTYINLTMGKGLYNNIDIFVHFIPYTQSTKLSQYGGIIRWGFYQATFLPITMSLTVHANTTNFNNQLSTRTVGADLTAGVNVNDVSLFVGAGPLTARGRFLGGDEGITSSLNTETETVNGTHSFIGTNVRFDQFFVSGQIDRYTLPVYSVKLGFRF